MQKASSSSSSEKKHKQKSSDSKKKKNEQKSSKKTSKKIKSPPSQTKTARKITPVESDDDDKDPNTGHTAEADDEEEEPCTTSVAAEGSVAVDTDEWCWSLSDPPGPNGHHRILLLESKQIGFECSQVIPEEVVLAHIDEDSDRFGFRITGLPCTIVPESLLVRFLSSTAGSLAVISEPDSSIPLFSGNPVTPRMVMMTKGSVQMTGYLDQLTPTQAILRSSTKSPANLQVNTICVIQGYESITWSSSTEKVSSIDFEGEVQLGSSVTNPGDVTLQVSWTERDATWKNQYRVQLDRRMKTCQQLTATVDLKFSKESKHHPCYLPSPVFVSDIAAVNPLDEHDEIICKFETLMAKPVFSIPLYVSSKQVTVRRSLFFNLIQRETDKWFPNATYPTPLPKLRLSFLLLGNGSTVSTPQYPDHMYSGTIDVHSGLRFIGSRNIEHFGRDEEILIQGLEFPMVQSRYNWLNNDLILDIRSGSLLLADSYMFAIPWPVPLRPAEGPKRMHYNKSTEYEDPTRAMHMVSFNPVAKDVMHIKIELFPESKHEKKGTTTKNNEMERFFFSWTSKPSPSSSSSSAVQPLSTPPIQSAASSSSLSFSSQRTTDSTFPTFPTSTLPLHSSSSSSKSLHHSSFLS